MVDDISLNLLHTASACLLVEIDVSMGLPSQISITSSKRSWLESVDYEGIPFRCRRCFKTRHNVDSCTRLTVKHLASWWKEVTPQLYRVDKEAGDPSTPQDVGGLTNVTSEKALEPTNNIQRAIRGLDCAEKGGVQNLKLLENAQADGWIEVKQKKGKKGFVGSICIAPPLEGGGVPGEVGP
ncbi:hypothetical protein SUGI_0622700 [Cryptomeria japonica]|nr:hypothetical protein SUGI_0622700 [Cryptomeria japonica]